MKPIYTSDEAHKAIATLNKISAEIRVDERARIREWAENRINTLQAERRAFRTLGQKFLFELLEFLNTP